MKQNLPDKLFIYPKEFKEGVYMRKKVRFFLLQILSAVMVLGICPQSTSASEPVMPLMGQWTDIAAITQDHTVQYYEITLPGDGKLDITLQSWMNYVAYKLWDEDLTKIYSSGELSIGSENEPCAGSAASLYLKKGIYYLEVYQFTGYTGTTYTNTGDYRLKAEFVDGNTNETEPNDKAPQSIVLLPGETHTSMMWEDDEYDYYQLTLDEAQTVKLSVKSWINYIDMKILDADFMDAFDMNGEEIGQITIEDGSENEPASEIFEYDLDKGTWYIFFRKFTGYTGTTYSNTGIYSIMLKED